LHFARTPHHTTRVGAGLTWLLGGLGCKRGKGILPLGLVLVPASHAFIYPMTSHFTSFTLCRHTSLHVPYDVTLHFSYHAPSAGGYRLQRLGNCINTEYLAGENQPNMSVVNMPNYSVENATLVRCASLSSSQASLATNMPTYSVENATLVRCAFYNEFCCVRASNIGLWLVRCSFSDRSLHSRMPLDRTHVRLKLEHACDPMAFLSGAQLLLSLPL
jgi:hypothetical protein